VGGEIVGSAIRRASKIPAKHNVEVDIAADLPMVSVDAVLLEQVLFNLLDNAAKYAPAETPSASAAGATRAPLAYRFSTKAAASLLVTWNASSRSSIASRRATGCDRAPAWGWRSPEASSKPCAVASVQAIAPTDRVRSSRSPFR
jgi:hypothetical protein